MATTLTPSSSRSSPTATSFDRKVFRRFVNIEPLGFAGSDPNLHRYVGNSPMTHTDPLGLCKDESISSQYFNTQLSTNFPFYTSGGVNTTGNTGSGFADVGKYDPGPSMWRQSMLDYYHDIMRAMIAMGDAINNGRIDPSVWHGSKQWMGNANWQRLKAAMLYSLNNYSDINDFSFVDGSSMNLPGIPGITIDATTFDNGDVYSAIMLLIHEPLHDFSQFGFGHGGWGDYGLGDVVGPTDTPSQGSYYDQFVDFLRGTSCGGRSLWSCAMGSVGRFSGGPKPMQR